MPVAHFITHFKKRNQFGYSGVIYQDIDFAEFLSNIINRFFDCVEVTYIKRLISSAESSISSNQPIVLTAGTMAIVGTVTSIRGNKAKILLRDRIVILPDQKIALSKKSGGRWQLVAYAIAK